jgi:hypothetical protein
MSYELKPLLNIGKIELNYEELKQTAIQQTAQYKGLVIFEEDVKEIKKIRAEMNKVIDRISAERIRIKKEYNVPVAEMEEKIKEVVNIIGAARDNLDEQVKAFEFRKRQERKTHFENIYLVDAIDGILFGQVYDPHWENESTPMSEAIKAYEDKIKRINGDLMALAELGDKRQCAIATEHYKKVLDLAQALSYARDVMRLFTSVGVIASEAEPIKIEEENNFLLGMEVHLEAAGEKREYSAIYFRTAQDHADAMKALDALGIPYVK